MSNNKPARTGRGRKMWACRWETGPDEIHLYRVGLKKLLPKKARLRDWLPDFTPDADMDVATFQAAAGISELPERLRTPGHDAIVKMRLILVGDDDR